MRKNHGKKRVATLSQTHVPTAFCSAWQFPVRESSSHKRCNFYWPEKLDPNCTICDKKIPWLGDSLCCLSKIEERVEAESGGSRPAANRGNKIGESLQKAQIYEFKKIVKNWNGNRFQVKVESLQMLFGGYQMITSSKSYMKYFPSLAESR